MKTPASWAASLKDQAFMVTGSTRGIGLGIAKALLECGGVVGIHGRSSAQVHSVCEALDSSHSRTIPLVADLTEADAAAELVQAFTAQTSRLDGLVNNAGSGKAIAFRGLTPEKWRSTFQLNLDATMQLCQAAYGVMRRQQSGSIVNIASLAAHGPGKWMGADYAASKSAVVSLTKSLAFESARLGIRVNAISPGMVETDMTAVLPESMRQGLHIPMGRFAMPSEIGSVAAFLLSEASNYITGQVLHVDGGLWMGNT
jgi:3-oxoacyl-[acyl-carrier protein] reductase